MENVIFPLLRWIVLAPFIGFFVNGFAGRKLPRPLVGILASLAIAISFIVSVISFLNLEEGTVLTDRLFTWIQSGSFVVDVHFRMDALSAVMALVVSGVSFLIHIYSIGYMADDRGFWRYFSYLNLFVFFMLILVLANNLLLLFVGWEGVGLCSYLLIGFWYEDNEKAAAGKKAFIVNRIGDAGFIVGMVLLFYLLSTKGIYAIDFGTIENHIVLIKDDSFWGISAPLLIGLLLFIGATGKSAQFPLYVWLPDAMAGPTPVSALIHAATMVTAGVYMLARMHFLYDFAPDALNIVLYVGCFTAFLGASIGLLQNDIKKVLAYSTISQLGYMFMAVGAGAYAAGIFHLTTHAFFKALLFMGAGSVIHGLHGEQDLTKMGGLKNDMKFTFILMTAGWLAISGIPPFAGFFSKDVILERVFGSGAYVVWAAGLFTAGMTAYYIARLIILTFLGEHRGHKAHESPMVMVLPMAVLGILSVFGGLIGSEKLFEHNFFHFLSQWNVNTHHEISYETLSQLIILSVSAGIAGIIIAFFVQTRGRAEKIKEKFQLLYRLIFNKYYVDEIYDFLVVKRIKWLADVFCFRVFDAGLIDGIMVNGSAGLTYYIGNLLRRIQTGNVQTYAFIFVLGLVLLIYYFVR
jgi:NADH-quinone oxidoreductase subunit L